MWTAAAGMLALTIAAPPATRAGIELTTEIANPNATPPQSSETSDASAKAPRAGRMLIDGERVRMEMTGMGPEGTGTAVIIFRGDRNVMWSVDAKRQSYTEVDRAKMQEMRAQSDAARAQMRAGRDKLPPAERARMQAMLAASEAQATKLDPPTIKDTGRADKVSGFACREFEVSRHGVKESEICVADWKTAGVTKADLASVGKLGKFQAESLEGMQARREGDDVLALFDALDGLPVRVRSFRGGQPRAEFHVLKIEHKALDAKLFEPPDGYKKRTFSISVPGAPKAPGAAGGKAPGAPGPDAPGAHEAAPGGSAS